MSRSTPWEAVWHGVAQWMGVVPSSLSTVLPNKDRWLAFEHAASGRRLRRRNQDDDDSGSIYLFTCDEMYEECPETPSGCDVTEVAAPANGLFGQTCAGTQGSLTIEHGANCDLRCNEGFLLSRQPTCIDGTLSSSTANCTIQTCDLSVLRAPIDGRFGDDVCTEAAGTISHGESCDLACEEGFQLSDQPTCSAGTLSSTTASCTWIPTIYRPAQCDFDLVAEQLAAFQRGDVNSLMRPTCHAYFLHLMHSFDQPAFVLKQQCSAETRCNLGSLVEASNNPALLDTTDVQVAVTSCVAVLTALAGDAVCEHTP